MPQERGERSPASAAEKSSWNAPLLTGREILAGARTPLDRHRMCQRSYATRTGGVAFPKRRVFQYLDETHLPDRKPSSPVILAARNVPFVS